MKIKLLPAIIAAAGFLSAPFVVAATYQSELTASYVDLDPQDANADLSFIEVEGKYYFSSVNSGNQPLAEAAFVGRASNLYVQLRKSELKLAGQQSDGYTRAIGADFFIPNSIFYVGAGVTESKVNGPALLGGSSDWDSSWFVKAGVTPISGLLVWSEFAEDVDVADEWNINAKYVLPLSGEQSLNFEGSYEKSKLNWNDDTISLAADYYIDRHLSIGGGFINTSYAASANIDTTTDYFIRARNFFTDSASIELSYFDGELDSGFLVGGSLRF